MTRGMVCIATLISMMTLDQPRVAAQTPHARVGNGDAAAANARTLLVTPDGRVFMWSRNSAPRRVEGLPASVAVAVGGALAMALTREGHVYSWSRGDARKPERVKGLKNVVRIAAGRAHQLALTSDGRVWAWGSNDHGQLGLQSSTEVEVPTKLPSLSAITAIDAGQSHSVAIAADGRGFAWGANTQGQLGDGTRITRRTPVRIALTGIVDIAAGATHTLAIRRDGTAWSWGSGSRGELGIGTLADAAVPAAIESLRAKAVRAGRRFSAAVTDDGSLMMWGANESGQLGDGTTLDRTTPVHGPSLSAISAVALGGRHSIAVTASGDVWTWGRNALPSEAMSDVPEWGPPIAPNADTISPTIEVNVSPPISGNWFTTAVTVTFTCSDDAALVSCPIPVVASDDGASRVISGTAVDRAGNRSTASVMVNIDRTAPVLTLGDWPDEPRTTKDHLWIRGGVSDATSGPADEVQCNGGVAFIVDGTFECVVPLQLGANTITVQGKDLAGNSTEVSLAATRLETTTAFAISPDSRSMIVDEIARLSLRDGSDNPVPDAEWSSSDSAVAILTEDDPPFVKALAPGTATILASKNGVAVEAAITVASGAVLAPGTTRWTIAATPGFTMEPPIFTHRVDPSVPDMFLVETQAFGSALLRAVTADGDVLWQQHSPGVPLIGDSFGGVIAGEFDTTGLFGFRAYLRLGEAGGVTPWRYESVGLLARPAQAPDGTIYAMEFVPGQDAFGDRIWDKHAIVIDGRSGALIGRHPLLREIETYIAVLDDQETLCTSNRTETAPDTTGPVVGSDGRGYLLVRRRTHHRIDLCSEQSPWPQRNIENGVDLVMLSGGGVQVDAVHAETCNVRRFAKSGCDEPATLTQVAPDGLGGVLAVWARGMLQSDGSIASQTMISRRNEQGALSQRSTDATNIDLVGQNGIIYTSSPSSYDATDVTTWTRKWSREHDGAAVIAAHPDGGAATYVAGELRSVGVDGQEAALPPVPLNLPSPIVQEFGSWIGVKDGKLQVVAGDFPDATRFAVSGGNRQGQMAVRRPGVGIFVKGHLASPLPYFMHLSLRITPADSSRWLANARFGRYFSEHVDVYGNPSLTIGAGPHSTDGGDTTAFCVFNNILESNLNRPRDQQAVPAYQQRVVFAPSEAFVIDRLLTLDSNYADNLKYECIPDDPEEFNSNSYISGLFDAAEISKPWFPMAFPSMFPGWLKPVPLASFK